MNYINLFQTIFILCVLTQIKAQTTVSIGFVDFTSIYSGAPNEEALRYAIPLASSEVRRAAKVFEAYTKLNNEEVNGEKVEFNIVIEESDYSHGSIFEAVCNLLDEDIRIILSPFGTAPGLQVAKIIGENLCEIPDLGHVILLSGSTQERTFSHNKPSTFSTMPTLYRMVSELIPYFREKAGNVTFVKTEGTRPGDPATSTCDDLENRFLEAGIVPGGQVWYMNDFENTPRSHYENVVDKVIEYNADLMIYCGVNKNIMDTIATIFKEQDYTPKAVITTANEFHVNETVTDFWTVASSAIGSEFQFEDAEYFKSEAEYIELYKQVFPEEFSENYSMGLFTMFACEIILKSMQERNTVDDINSILDAIKKNRFNTLLGELYYSATHENQNSGVALQKTPTYMGIIGPYQVTNMSVIYPMPTWKEREFRTSYHGIEIASIVLLGAIFVNIMGVMLYISIKKEVALESVIIAIGVALICTGTILWSTSHVSAASCMAVPILLVLGLLLTIGTITFTFAKTKHEIKHEYKTFGYILLAGVLLETVVFIFWGIFAQPKVDREIVDPFRNYENYLYCKTDKLHGVFIGLASVPILIAYLYGLYLTIVLFLRSKRRGAAFKFYAFALYNIGICGIIISVLEGVGISSNMFAQQILRTIIIVIAIVVVINIMFISVLMKTKQAKRQHNSSSFKQTNSHVPSTSSQVLARHQERQAYYRDKALDTEEEIKGLRKDLKNLRKELERFKA